MLNQLLPTLTFAFTPGPFELIVLGVIVLVLFGNRLPGAAKSLGQSFTAFKKGVKEGTEDDNPAEDNQNIN